MSTRSSVITALALVIPLLSNAEPPSRAAFASVPEPQLKAAYLDCDRLASRTVLDPGSAAVCSVIAEELKHRVFGGEFDRLLAWWHAERAQLP